jgi:hypothetical protein
MTVRQALRYLGPDSPWGPAFAALSWVVFMACVGAAVCPPLFFVLSHVFGWWWRLWL